MTERLNDARELDPDGVDQCTNAARTMAPALAERVKVLEEMDREAATHVESVIALRTGFTGQWPYVGWKGLGLALTEALDERDALAEEVRRLRETVAEMSEEAQQEVIFFQRIEEKLLEFITMEDLMKLTECTT